MSGTDEDAQMTAWGDSEACRSVHDAVERLAADPTCQDPIVFLSIGPLHEVAAFLQKYPETCKKVHFVGMQGSMEIGYYGREGCVRENNVKLGVRACQAVLSSPTFLSKRLATLDTCGVVQLDKDDFFEEVTQSKSGVARAYVENIQIWHGLFVKTRPWLSELYRWPERSSILFDTVAAIVALEDPPIPKRDTSVDTGSAIGTGVGTAVDSAVVSAVSAAFGAAFGAAFSAAFGAAFGATERVRNAESSPIAYREVELLVTDSAHTLDAAALLTNPDYARETVSGQGKDITEKQVAEWKEEAQKLRAMVDAGEAANVVHVTSGWRNYRAFLQEVALRIAGNDDMCIDEDEGSA